MNINLNGPVTLVLQAEMLPLILDALSKGLTYQQGKVILDETIIPQLQEQDPNNKPAPAEVDDGLPKLIPDPPVSA